MFAGGLFHFQQPMKEQYSLNPADGKPIYKDVSRNMILNDVMIFAFVASTMRSMRPMSNAMRNFEQTTACSNCCQAFKAGGKVCSHR